MIHLLFLVWLFSSSLVLVQIGFEPMSGGTPFPGWTWEWTGVVAYWVSVLSGCGLYYKWGIVTGHIKGKTNEENH